MAILSGKPESKSTAAAKAAVAKLQDLSAKELIQRVFERRAIESVTWAMPAVNFDLMHQAMVRETKGAFNQIVYWSRLPDWKNQTLTPNPDVIYLMPFFDTKDGPVVMEIPPADDGVINGTIMDSWQVPLDDVGPAGADKGNGRQIPDRAAGLRQEVACRDTSSCHPPRIRVTRCCARS